MRGSIQAFRLGTMVAAFSLAEAGLLADDFAPLFNGRDLSGWVEMGKPGGFVVEEGTLLLKTPQNYPNWLRTEKEYENFVLRLEYRMSGWCETGLFLHAPLYGDLAESGLRIHLRHDRTEEGSRSTGGIYDVAPPLTLANKPVNEWNALEIHMDWPVLRVKLNDVLIQDVNLEVSDALRSKARRGYIGLDDLNCRIGYRNVQIRELPNKDRKWTSLSNGKDLKGWTSEGKVQWVVEDGKIVGSNGDGFLFTEESFGAFEFKTYFRTTPHANGGVLYRRSSANRGGYEIQIYNQPGATNPTGSIYGRAGATAVPCRDGEWCELRFISDGAYTGVWINGKKVAESHSLQLPDQGLIGFQMHSEGRVEYLDPKIRSLR
jgi:hypothetical protein